MQKYIGQCDRIRLKPGGEEFWQSLMKNSKQISRKEFMSKINPQDILDDDDTLDNWLVGDTFTFHKSIVNNKKYYFIKTSGSNGYEFIWELMNLIEKILKESAQSGNPKINALIDIISQSHSIQTNPFSGRELVIDDIGQTELVWFDNMLHISSLDAFSKGKGDGSKMLQIITDAADQLNYTCSLDASPYGTGGGLKKKDLINFYLRHGFEIVPGQYGFKDVNKILKYVISKNGQDEGVDMIRKPR